ncbi:MAG: hypothetical protein ACRD0H_20190, partial [Actinomycetes bacterium]
MGIALLQRRLSLLEFGLDEGRSLHRAGVLGKEHFSHGPQVVVRMGGLSEQAHRGESNHHHRRSRRDPTEQETTSASRLADSADHCQGGVGVHQFPDRVGMHLATPRRQNARQLAVAVTRQT